MPNAMINGIAQSQTGSANNSDPTQPWNNLVFDSGATAKQGGYQTGSGAMQAGQNFSGSGLDQWYTSGANGAGYYRAQNAQEQAQSGQQYGAQQFRQNIPQTENNMYGQLSSGVNNQMNSQIKGVQQNNSSRGLLYGGLNAGQEGAVRAGAASSLATGRSSINSGVENAANSMDQGAIDTGLAIQQQQQTMQNAIYSNAMAQMNASSSAMGGLLSAVGTGVGMYLGSGTSTGAVAGGLLGSQAGKAVA